MDEKEREAREYMAVKKLLRARREARITKGVVLFLFMIFYVLLLIHLFWR